MAEIEDIIANLEGDIRTYNDIVSLIEEIGRQDNVAPFYDEHLNLRYELSDKLLNTSVYNYYGDIIDLPEYLMEQFYRLVEVANEVIRIDKEKISESRQEIIYEYRETLNEKIDHNMNRFF